MLELQNICYRVSTPEGELDILRDISITIPDQRLMVFTGPNGGGKTTLAKIIMGLVQPTSGRILYNGQDVTPLSITDRARLGISYGFQQPPRFKGITVHDLLRLAAGKEKLTKDQCCAYLTKVGLCANDYLDREVDVSLSGGEVKRIEIATILARRGLQHPQGHGLRGPAVHGAHRHRPPGRRQARHRHPFQGRHQGRDLSHPRHHQPDGHERHGV